MKTSTFIISSVLVAGTRGFTANTRFATRPSLVSSTTSPKYSTITSTSITPTQLNAWSPFGKQAVVEPEPVVVKELEPGPLEAKNAVAFAVWVSLVVWAFGFAPGIAGSDADTALINRLISQPVPRPEEVNELWFAVWNSFAIVPAALGALATPTGNGQRFPAAPFLWGSGAFGYFALGPYFSTRTDRSSDSDFRVSQSDLGWASKNIFENRIFGVVLSAIAISIPFTSDILVPGFDFAAKAADYAALAGGSRFVAVASADIFIMSALASVLVSEDAKLRGWEDKSLPLLVGTLLLPVLGPSLYIAARPQLEE